MSIIRPSSVNNVDFESYILDMYYLRTLLLFLFVFSWFLIKKEHLRVSTPKIINPFLLLRTTRVKTVIDLAINHWYPFSGLEKS